MIALIMLFCACVGGLRKNWLTRYFVLRSGILGYYKSKEVTKGAS